VGIDVKMDSGEIAQGDLGIDGMSEYNEKTQNKDGSKFLVEFQMNEEELHKDFQEHNNPRPGAGQQQYHNVQYNDLPPGLNNHIYVPQTRIVTCPVFVANQSTRISLLMITIKNYDKQIEKAGAGRVRTRTAPFRARGENGRVDLDHRYKEIRL